MKKFAVFMAVAVLAFWPAILLAADAVPVVVQQPDVIERLIAQLPLPLIAVVGGIWYFLKGKTQPQLPPNEFKTGRPLLDLVVQAALEKFKDQPVVVEIIKAEAMAIKMALDKYGVPEIPLSKP